MRSLLTTVLILGSNLAVGCGGSEDEGESESEAEAEAEAEGELQASLGITQAGGSADTLPEGALLQLKYKDGEVSYDIATADDAAVVDEIYFRVANSTDQMIIETGIGVANTTVAALRGMPLTKTTGWCVQTIWPDNYGDVVHEGLVNEFAAGGDCTIDISSAGAPLTGSVTFESGTEVTFDFP
ncbi:MAG: hypothetical protein AABZ30_04690 [Myxococcota bacterium]